MSGTNPSTPTESVSATWGPIIVSVLVLSIFLAAIAIAWWTKDASLGLLLGTASANATTAVGYWLGSSSGSKSKDQALAKAATTLAPGVSP